MNRYLAFLYLLSLWSALVPRIFVDGRPNHGASLISHGGFESYTPQGNIRGTSSDYLIGQYGGWNLIAAPVIVPGVIYASGPAWTGSPAPEGKNYVCLQSSASIVHADPIPCYMNVSYSLSFSVAARTAPYGGNGLFTFVNGEPVLGIGHVTDSNWQTVTSSTFKCTGSFSLSFNTFDIGDHTVCLDNVRLEILSEIVPITHGGFEDFTPEGLIGVGGFSTSSDYLVGHYSGWDMVANPSIVPGVIFASGSFWTGAPAPEGKNYVCLQSSASVSHADPIACSPGSTYSVSFNMAAREAPFGDNGLFVFVNGQVVYSNVDVTDKSWRVVASTPFLCPDDFSLSFQSFDVGDHTVCIDDVKLLLLAGVHEGLATVLKSDRANSSALPQDPLGGAMLKDISPWLEVQPHGSQAIRRSSAGRSVILSHRR